MSTAASATVPPVHIVRTILLLLVIGLAACSSDAPGPAPTATATGVAAVSPPTALATPGAGAAIPGKERLRPLTDLGPCSTPPPARETKDVAGLILPSKAVPVRVTPADPLTNVQGYVAMTPVQLRAFYQRHPDVTVISVEDEDFEAEVLFAAEDRRVFVKAQAVCELGSVFVAVVSPESP